MPGAIRPRREPGKSRRKNPSALAEGFRSQHSRGWKKALRCQQQLSERAALISLLEGGTSKGIWDKRVESCKERKKMAAGVDVTSTNRRPQETGKDRHSRETRAIKNAGAWRSNSEFCVALCSRGVAKRIDFKKSTSNRRNQRPPTAWSSGTPPSGSHPSGHL